MDSSSATICAAVAAGWCFGLLDRSFNPDRRIAANQIGNIAIGTTGPLERNASVAGYARQGPLVARSLTDPPMLDSSLQPIQ